jgi:hypothetical protein
MSASDGIAPGGLGFLPNPKAPEENYPNQPPGDAMVYNDGTTCPIVKGYQPITSTNPNGDYQGVPIMAVASNGGVGMRRDGSFEPQ